MLKTHHASRRRFIRKASPTNSLMTATLGDDTTPLGQPQVLSHTPTTYDSTTDDINNNSGSGSDSDAKHDHDTKTHCRLQTSPSVASRRARRARGMATGPPMTAIQDPSSLDSAIRQLLEQEADIQARLAALLPAKYGPNVSMELAMLRYKLRALKSYFQRHGTSRHIALSLNRSWCPSDTSLS